eukprot:TRINITY_DN99_c7_g1_i1.p1 TRINITY_DN99_c7_g1~~TRINITY_DN99_c7_g1_i1.p1  ORF type:complete len:321 (+),score=68.65 TRINITY_DN99_c7_g1_i1:50-1012(+)
MSIVVLSALIVSVAEDAPGDLTPDDAAPQDEAAPQEAPLDNPDVFEAWCSEAAHCVVDPTTNFANDVQCVQGACQCTGAWEDPGKGTEYGGWVCVPLGESIPQIPMEYEISWEGDSIDCINRPAGFTETLRNELLAFFAMTELELSEPFCGSIHYLGRGNTALAGKTGFADTFANNPNNPYGAPTVVGQKSSIASTACTPVLPVLTMAKIGALCQPLSCVAGYTLVNSGNINVLSACVVTPPPGVVATLPPSTGTAPPFVQVRDSDDTMHYGGLLGIAFGSAILVGGIVAVVVYTQTKSSHEQLDEEQQQNMEQNGPDKI